MISRVAVFFAVLLAGSAVLPAPGRAADPAPQRRVVFEVRKDTTVRTRLRQESDISASFNSPSAVVTSGGGGGQTVSGMQGATVVTTVTVDVVLVAPDGSLGCDVTTHTGDTKVGPTRVWIAPDGRSSWKGNRDDADPSVLFLLPMLSPQFIPPDTAVGSEWKHERERYSVRHVVGNVAQITVDGDFGEPSHGGSEKGTIDYDVATDMPAHVELDIHSHVDQPMRVTTTDLHVSYKLVSDTFAKSSAPGH